MASTFETLRDVVRRDLAGDAIECWSEDGHSRHLTDWSGRRHGGGSPLAVAYPRSTQEVSAVARACHATGTSIVPQGGLTGLVGGAVPPPGSLVLSLERMATIEKVDRADFQMTVQAGVPLQRVQEAAAEAGLFFPLDLGARGSALIGGNLATNAGGNRVLRYGMARDLTLGIEVVTADGTIIDAMNRMTKNNAGYDLKHLFLGSEGTLGIITRAVLKLVPKPDTQNVALCAIDSYESVLEVLSAARKELGDSLSAFEVMWDEFFAVATAGNARRIGFDADHPFVVLIEALGFDASVDVDRFETFLENMVKRELVCDALSARSQRDVLDFWAVRDASGELSQRFGRAINFDVSVPTSMLDLFAQTCRERIMATVPNTRVLVFGHIADGNIHFACLDCGADAKERIEDVVYATVGEWGGSISAEHGVGLEKKAFLNHSRSTNYVDMMRALKRSLDPQSLLNPGKIF